MDKIVVGVDFSKGSLHAFEYAKMLAKKANASIHLVWVDSFSIGETMICKNNELRAEAKKNVEQLIEEHAKDKDLKELKYKLLKGKVAEEISRYAHNENADCIVLGTHGVNGYEEYWIGSNANRVIIYSKCPVFTIRHDYDIHQPIKNILLPIDNTNETLRKTDFTAKIAKIFGAKVNLLGIHSTMLKSMHRKVDRLLETAEKQLTEKGIEHTKEYIAVDNIAKDILNFMNQHPSNLVAIMSERESATGNVLLGEYAHKIVNHCSTPVLSIR